MSLENTIKHFESEGYNVISYHQFVNMLQQINYDMTINYLYQTRCDNCAEGNLYYTVSCHYKGSNIGFANINGLHLKNEHDYRALQNIRLNYCFIFKGNLYVL